MTKNEAIKQFDGVRNLAEALGITREAVYQWPDRIPRLREYEIRDILAQRETEKVSPSNTATPVREAA